jgi:hypothetical protein
MLSSIYWDCVVSDSGVVTHNCFGQVVGPFISFQTYMSFNPAEGDVKGEGLTYIWKVLNTGAEDRSEELRMILFKLVTECCNASQMNIKWVHRPD